MYILCDDVIQGILNYDSYDLNATGFNLWKCFRRYISRLAVYYTVL